MKKQKLDTEMKEFMAKAQEQKDKAAQEPVAAAGVEENGREVVE